MGKRLPVARSSKERSGRPASDCGKVRPSRRGRWRALSLILIHAAAAAHIAHWYATGSTLTPVEPSEAMQTLGSEALLNAGFVFFLVTILGTLVVGRFFCGWGCHIVALQDLCTWILRKLRIRPRPFRSRLLMLVPLGGALYMFVLPTLVRWQTGGERAALQAHFFTDDFWDRFPTWPIALLTFAVCGFLIVVLLGNKGFCTYGCPYGGIFSLVDKVTPGKIRVTDACEGCAHCTATCTSNVRVHEEVRDYGMVVNTGCMKCLDCIDVCPKDALYFGFGPTALKKGRPPTAGTPRRYDFTWPEEFTLAILFLASVAVLTRLYDAVPLLLALGLSSISAYILLGALRLIRGSAERVAATTLRRGGKLTAAGVAFLVVALAWAAFLVHSGALRLTTRKGYEMLGSAQGAMAAAGGALSPEAGARLRRALEILERGRRLALFPMARLEAGIADAHRALGEHGEAETAYRRAVDLAPRYSAGRVRLAAYHAGRDELDAATSELEQVMRRDPMTPEAHTLLADVAIRRGRAGEGADLLAAVLEDHPGSDDVRLTYGVLLSHDGRMDAALAEMRHVITRRPGWAEAHYKLGQLLANQGQRAEALASFRNALRAEPAFAAARLMAARTSLALGQEDVAVELAAEGARLAPFDRQMVGAWAQVVARTGGLDGAIAAAEGAPTTDRAARYRLFHLYRAAGRTGDAQRIADELQGEGVRR